MVPWIKARMQGTMFDSHRPVFALVALINELEHGNADENLVLTEGPRTVVYQPGYGYYLLREGRSVAFATFNSPNGHNIMSVGLRYSDPVDRNSKPRKQRITDGWPGIAELLASVVRHSSHWKNLETIETAIRPATVGERTYDNAKETWFHTYDVWATPKQNWSEYWTNKRPFYIHRDEYFVKDAAKDFRRNQPELVARVQAERCLADGSVFETVRDLELYPEYTNLICDAETSESHLWRQLNFFEEIKPDAIKPPMYLDMYDVQVMEFPPHSELKMRWKR